MRFWEMLSFHIILLLLAWRCSEVSAENEEPINEELDQLATASVVRIINNTGNQSTLVRPFISDTEMTTIRYENSNGFVPIIEDTQTVVGEGQTTFAENYSVDSSNLTSEEHLSLFIKNPEYPKDDKSLENDPFYSTEARIFLSLTQPVMNRRSSDFQDSSDDFELLRINNDTPVVASYDNFYDSLSGSDQHPRNKGREIVDHNEEQNFHQDRQNMEREKNYYDNRGERNKKVENYMLTNYGENAAAQNPREPATDHTHYFSYSQIHDDENRNGYKELTSPRNNFPTTETFDYNSLKKSKISPNFHTTPQQNYNNQREVSSYQFNTQNSQQLKHLADVNYHQKRPKPKSSFNTHRSRLNVKQYTPAAKTKSYPNMQSNFDTISPRNQNYNPNTRSEESPGYFEHEALFNREEINQNYDKLEDAKELSDENYEYVEITEKPKRFRKLRRRPSIPDDSKRLPKEHREFDDSIDIDETTKPRTRFRPRIRNHKEKVHTWPEHEEDLDEGGFETAVESTVNSETRKQKLYNQNRKNKGNSWANVSPNVEISHSSGIEIDQVGKPKLVVPVKVNILPVANFDHATALDNSQGFDLSNAVLQNFVTATPIAFSNGSPITPITPMLNTPHTIFNSNIGKNHNVKVQTPVPEVIVGQSTLQNPIQTILVPQQNYENQNKFGQNMRNTFSSNNHNPYVQNQNLQPNNLNILQQNLSPQNVQGNTPIYIPNQNAVQHFQNPHSNQIQNVQSNPQFNNPHPTSQTFEHFQQNIGQPTSAYNVQVNSHGLQTQTLSPIQTLYTPQSNVVGYSTTPSTNFLHNVNSENAESNGKRNGASGTNGQYLASASFSVGEQIQNQINALNLRPQVHENFNQAFRNDNFLPKMKGFSLTGDGSQNFLNFHNQNGPGTQIFNRDHQTEQITQASNVIAQTYKDQNQQILKVANEIFESTLKQLKQLQRSQNLRPNRLGNQNSQDNSHFQNGGTKNVEIINTNIRPSPIDQTFINPTENSNPFAGFGLTTAFPIFGTTAFDKSPRPPNLSTIGPLSIHGYVDSLTEIGANENDQRTSPTTNSKPNSPDQRQQPVLFNPINFVPNTETLKSQKVLNNKYNVNEPMPQGLNLVPLIPGGNFYRNSYFAQDNLNSKPKLSSDLQKYAEEMFKESLKTIYNTQKWNNDHKAQSSEISSVTTSPKVKEDLHDIKFSIPDIKPSKQILEAHFTETGTKDVGGQTSEHFSKPMDEFKKLPSLDFADVLKPEFKLPSPISLEPVRFYYKPNIHLSRPSIADTKHPDFKFNTDFGSMDYIHDFLTPPKKNAFISKSPFNEPIPKRRPGHKRPISDNGGVKFHGRPESGPPRPPPPGVVESSASNIAHQSFSLDAPRYEFLQSKPPFDIENPDFEVVDYQNSYSGIRGQNSHSRYPSLTTSGPLLDDYNKPGSHDYDYNHPRMHNLMGLLRKNKRLPPGNSQSLFRKKDVNEAPPKNDKRQDPTQFPKDNSRNFIADKSDVKNFQTILNSTQTEKSHA